MALTLSTHQVLQRTGPEGITIPRVDAPLSLIGPDGLEALVSADGQVVLLPTGGPYLAHLPDGAVVADVHVGDLWLLAGQSNIEGNGDWVDPEPPHAHVRMLGLDRRWAVAQEPLHRPLHSVDPVRMETIDDVERRRQEQTGDRTIGTGPGLPFARMLAERTGVPIGLVTAAHDGSTMREWDPRRREEGGHSLYGSTALQVQATGGSIHGVIWYQGESDSHHDGALEYQAALDRILTALRQDFGASMVIQVQQCRLDVDPSLLVPRMPLLTDDAWSQVRELQRTSSADAMVSTIDLRLHDFIHLDRISVRRLGHRLARAAFGERLPAVGQPRRDGDLIMVPLSGLTVTQTPCSVAGVTLHA
ncbi:MAG: hypothetical protein ACI867_000440, partial [Glaciecola sp.]